MRRTITSQFVGEFMDLLNSSLTEAEDAEYPCRPVMVIAKGNSTALGRFTGDIGLSRVREFHDSLHDLVREDLTRIIVDFSAVSLSRTAVGALVGFAASAFGRGVRLYIYQPSAQLLKSLEELGLTSFFSFLYSEDDVLVRLTV